MWPTIKLFIFQSKSFIQQDDSILSFLSPQAAFNLNTSPKTFASPSMYLNPPNPIKPLSDEKGSTHHRISGKSTVSVMTPISSLGMMGPPLNPPHVKSELSAMEGGGPIQPSFIDSPANSNSSGQGFYFDYPLNSQPNFTSTPVILSKSLQLNESKMVSSGARSLGALAVVSCSQLGGVVVFTQRTPNPS